MTEVRKERTGWRDMKINDRHRKWGVNCPAVDLDFILIEYNHGIPVALVEYKNKHAAPVDLNHATYRALKHLADHHGPGPLPFLIATYCSNDWWFVVDPVNDAAKKAYSHILPGQYLTEQRFVKSLYFLRSTELGHEDSKTIEGLNNRLPEAVDLEPS